MTHHRADTGASPPGHTQGEDSAFGIAERVRGHMPSLDGWRGLAILVVVLHNGGTVLNADGGLLTTLVRTALAAGWTGVSLFFVLSGFLITGILLDTRSSPNFLRDFYVRRTLRVFPLYYVSLVVIFLIVPLFVPAGEWTESVQSKQVWYWLYLPNWSPLFGEGIGGLSHFWSLGVEEQFYLAWPLLLLLTGERWFGAAALTVAVGAFASRWWMHNAGFTPEALYQFTNARADALAVGALLALVARRPAWMGLVLRARHGALAVVTVGLLGVVAWSRGLEPYDSTVLVVGQTLVVLLFALLMLVTIQPATGAEYLLTRAVSAPWLRTLGKYSYAIYVLHFPVHMVVRDRVTELVNGGGAVGSVAWTIVYGLALLGTSTFLAFGSWHLIEHRFLVLRDRLAPRPLQAPAA